MADYDKREECECGVGYDEEDREDAFAVEECVGEYEVYGEHDDACDKDLYEVCFFGDSRDSFSMIELEHELLWEIIPIYIYHDSAYDRECHCRYREYGEWFFEEVHNARIFTAL